MRGNFGRHCKHQRTAMMQASRPSAAPVHNNGDDDDDSHTTLSRGGEQEQDDIVSIASSADLLASPSPPRQAAAAAAAAAASPAESSVRSVISPSTQTLNVLSQHDAAGGGNLQYDMSNLDQDAMAMTASQQDALAASQQVVRSEQDAAAVTASQQVVRSERDDFRGWKMITVALTKPEALGMTVRRLTLQNPPRSYTIIRKVKPKSQAEAAGVLPGDIVGAKYEEVARWGNGPRPVAFCILRPPPGVRSKHAAASPARANRPAARSSSPAKTPSSNQAKTPAQKSSPAPKVVTMERHVADDNVAVGTVTNAERAAANTEADQRAALLLAHRLSTQLLPPESGGTASGVVQDKSKSSPPPTAEDTVPFCKACQKPNAKSRAHHALCPKHPQFDNSGALEKLELIRRGVETGCEACKHFYQHGRIVNSNIAHIHNCPRRKQPLRQNGEVLCVNEKETLALSSEKSQGRGAPSSKSAQKKETNAKKNTSNKKGEPRSKRGAASKNDSSTSEVTEKAVVARSTSKKKAATEKKSDATKKKGTVAKKATGRKKDSGGRGSSQTLTIASSNPITEEIDAGLGQSMQETLGSTGACAAGRRTRKKPRYEYESDSDSDDEAVPLVVGTASKKKRLVTPAPKKKTKKSAASKSNADSFMKPSWVPCANPWGLSGYQEGDVVLVTPSGGFSHHETIYGGDRFTVSPFGSDSDYDNTHRTPSEGFDVILLTRDPNAQHPWGFTYRRHEFGGACLVTSVDSLSPAASAVYRGNESQQTDRASLRIHDMILSMNGKSIGGMTELGVSVELDVCGRELELVVARYRDSDGAARQLVALERSEWTSFDDAVNDKRRLDWFEMNGPGAATSPSINMLEESDFTPFDFRGNSHDLLGSPQYGNPAEAQNRFHNQSPRSQQFSLSHLSLASPQSLTSRRSGRASQASRGRGPRSDDSGVYADDDEAWLGCVCGEIHPEPVRVFWIQCDDCRSWYNVAPVCVGFNELEASSVGTWVCRGCGDSVMSDQASACNSRPVQQVVIPRGSFGKRLSAVAQSNPSDRNSLLGTPGSTGSKRKNSQLTATEILEDRKRRKTEDGCFLPLRTPRKNEDGTYARPCGRGPPGMVWDAVRGMFTPRSKSKVAQKYAPPAPKKDDVVTPQSKDKNSCESPVIECQVVLPADRSTDERRTEDGCFLPLRKPKKREDGTYARPCGRGPPGMVWDAVRGMFTPGSKAKVAQKYAPPAPKKDDGAISQSGDKSASQSPVVERQVVLPADPLTDERRTEDGCFLPLRKPNRKEDGTYARPCGRGPPGMVWDATRGMFTPGSKAKVAQKHAPPAPKKDDGAISQSRDKSASQSPSETVAPSASPADPLTNGNQVRLSPPGGKKSSKKLKRGSREEREAEREKRMTDDGCLRPKVVLKTNADGTYARPRGRGPTGMIWDAHRGVYAPPKRKAKSLSTLASPKETLPSPKESAPSATKPSIDVGRIKLVVTGTGITGVVSPEEQQEPKQPEEQQQQPKFLPVGTLVSVAERVWIGSNKAGGIGTVIDYQHAEDGTIFYDVKYSLGGKETGIDRRFVSPHDFSGRGSVMRWSKK